MHKTFKLWIEAKDIFGFEKETRPQKKNSQDSQPIRMFDIEKIIHFLGSYNVGQLQPGKFKRKLRADDGSAQTNLFQNLGQRSLMQPAGRNAITALSNHVAVPIPRQIIPWLLSQIEDAVGLIVE